MHEAASVMEPELFTFFGYSQTARFDGALYQPPDGPPIVSKARWQPWARACDIFPDGRFDEYMTRAFIELRMIKRSETERDGPFSPVKIYPVYGEPHLFEYEPRETHLGRVVCFEYGEADAADLAHEFQGRARFEVPGLVFGDEFPDDEPPAETIDLSIVIKRVRERCAPLFDALRSLRREGFYNVFLHAIVPASPHPIEHIPSARLRQKLAAVFNDEFRRFSAATGIPLIDVGEDLTSGGIRLAKLERDRIHLSSVSAVFSLKKIVALRNERRRQ